MKKILFLLFLTTVFLHSQTDNQTNNGIDLITLITAFIGAIIGGAFTIIGGYFINKWNSKSQLEHFQINLLVESRKEWMRDLTNLVSEYIQISMENYWKYYHFISEVTPENSEKHSFASISTIVKIDFLHTKLICKIDFKKEKEATLYKKLGNFNSDLGNIINHIFDTNILYEKKKEIDKSTSHIRILLNDIIQEEQEKISELRLN